MDKQKSEFHKLSKQDWLNLIEGSLKSGDLNDLSWMVNHDLEGLPFAHASDLDDIPEPFRKKAGTNEWLSGCYSTFADLPDSLEGYQALALTEWINQDQLRNILSENPEIIEIRINSKNTNNFEQYLEEIHTFFTEDNKKREFCIELSDFNSIEVNNVHQALKSYDFVQFIISNENILPEDSLIEQYSSFFTKFAKCLLELEEPGTSLRIFKRIKLGHRIKSSSFLYETALIRALKLLWYKLQEKLLNQVEELRIDCSIDLASLSSDPNHQLILGTSAAASAVIAGVDTLYLLPDLLQSEEVKVRQRLSRNIQLILKKEVGLDNVQDPLSGSYAVEHLTKLLAASIWKEMEEKLA